MKGLPYQCLEVGPLGSCVNTNQLPGAVKLAFLSRVLMLDKSWDTKRALLNEERVCVFVWGWRNGGSRKY